MNCYNAHLSIGVHSSLEQKKKKKNYFTFTLLYLFFIISYFTPFHVSLPLHLFFLPARTFSNPLSLASMDETFKQCLLLSWPQSPPPTVMVISYLSISQTQTQMSRSPLKTAGPKKLKPRTPTAVVSSYSTTTRKGLSKKRKEKSTMRKEFTPFINLFSESATVGFWVCQFFQVSLLLCFPIWLC